MLHALAIALGLIAAPPAAAQGLLERLLAPQASQDRPKARRHLRRVRKRAPTPRARTRGAAARAKSSPARAAAVPETVGRAGDSTPIVPRPVPTVTVTTPFRERFFFQ